MYGFDAEVHDGEAGGVVSLILGFWFQSVNFRLIEEMIGTRTLENEHKPLSTQMYIQSILIS